MLVVQKIQKLIHWLERRDLGYIVLRLFALLQRYGITSSKARKRTLDCVRLLARYDCYPTFPTPGRVVSKHAAFFRELQHLGAELAVHGYDHVDFHSLTPEEVTQQFVKATHAYQHNGIQSDGFRCPYLSYTDELLTAIPHGLFNYSSNKAIWWDVFPAEAVSEATAIFDNLSRFYQAVSSETTVSAPTISRGSLIEIPASVPDDLQLYDGLRLGEQGLAQAWLKILRQTYQRGELFVLLFHPESYYQCAQAFESLLSVATQLQPAVWITRLRDVSDWWWEKSRFVVDISPEASGLHIRFDCSEPATVLVRNIETGEPTHPWHGLYHVLDGRECRVAADPWPFVGVLPGVPDQTVAFLQEQGYIVETGERASHCGVRLDAPTVARLENPVQLIAYIESTPAPLVRFWRWPNEYRSVLCITGDLDALSLVDYFARLLPW
jgi:peptidoglycan/xylan/chitin deacetylase (PgdA/CDA1 family)